MMRAALVVLGALSVGMGTGSLVFPALGLLGLLLLVASSQRISIPRASMTDRIWTALAIASGLATPYLLGSGYWMIAVLLSVAGIVASLVSKRTQLATVILISYPLVASAVLMSVMPGETIDVWFLHREAGSALEQGGNPYADLQVPNGAPDASDEFIVGYPYPPVPLVAYAGASSLLGESRWITIAAWVAVSAAFATRGRTNHQTQLLGWALVAHPSWALMLWTGWTEPLSVALIVATWAWWNSMPTRTSALAAALASKQYFAIVGAVVTATRALRTPSKLLVLGGAAALTAPALFWGFDEAYDAMIGLHTRQPYRPDASTLYALLNHLGIELRIPSLVALVIAVGVGVWLGRRSTDRAGFLLASATCLSVLFFLGSQAFANYWFVVFAYLICAMASTPDSADTDQNPISSEPANP